MVTDRVAAAGRAWESVQALMGKGNPWSRLLASVGE